ncbi:hypothetical protein ACF0H5_001326 [Mactra antiquata]
MSRFNLQQVLSLLDDHDDEISDYSKDANETEMFTDNNSIDNVTEPFTDSDTLDALFTAEKLDSVFIQEDLSPASSTEESFNTNDFVEIEIYIEDGDNTGNILTGDEYTGLINNTDSNGMCDEPLTYIDLDENNNEVNDYEQACDQPIDLCIRKNTNEMKTIETIETITLQPNQNNQVKTEDMTKYDNNEFNQYHDEDLPLPLNKDAESTEDIRHKRRKVKNIDTWKKSIRKRRRQAGLDYVSSRGVPMSKKSTRIQKDCKGKCRFACSLSFSDEDINEIHSYFWSMDDDRKMFFMLILPKEY